MAQFNVAEAQGAEFVGVGPAGRWIAARRVQGRSRPGTTVPCSDSCPSPLRWPADSRCPPRARSGWLRTSTGLPRTSRTTSGEAPPGHPRLSLVGRGESRVVAEGPIGDRERPERMPGQRRHRLGDLDQGQPRQPEDRGRPRSLPSRADRRERVPAPGHRDSSTRPGWPPCHSTTATRSTACSSRRLLRRISRS